MEHEEIKEKVRNILLGNLEEGRSDYLDSDYSYIKPSPGTYPFQWWWDTFFHVYILCCLGEHDIAKRNMKSLFALQAEDGFVGHMIYWNRLFPKNIWNIVQAKPSWSQLRPHMSCLIQPSFAAQAVARIFEGDGDEEFAREMYEKISKYYDWLQHNRVFYDDSLIVTVSPNETGIDWKTSFDEVFDHKGRASPYLYLKVLANDTINFFKGYDSGRLKKSRCRVQEVGINTIYAYDLHAMSELGKRLGIKDDYKKQAKKVGESIMEKMYSKEKKAFFDVSYPGQNHLESITPTIFFPLMLQEVPDEVANEVTDTHLKDGSAFDVKYPLPSASKHEKSFYPEESRFIWRGPTWVYYNWFLYRCFRNRGLHEIAEMTLNSVEEFIGKSGFREYYNPFTGDGYGAKDFTWSGLILDMMRVKEEYDNQI